MAFDHKPKRPNAVKAACDLLTQSHPRQPSQSLGKPYYVQHFARTALDTFYVKPFLHTHLRHIM